jgi:hypothetical protein
MLATLTTRGVAVRSGCLRVHWTKCSAQSIAPSHENWKEAGIMEKLRQMSQAVSMTLPGTRSDGLDQNSWTTQTIGKSIPGAEIL